MAAALVVADLVAAALVAMRLAGAPGALPLGLVVALLLESSRWLAFSGPRGGRAFVGPRGGVFVNRNFGHRHFVNFNHRRFNHRRFVAFGFFPGYYDYGYYGGGCSWLYRNAVATGSPYWWNQYQYCIGYYD